MNKLYIDLGTANTLIYAKGKGLLLNEPSMVAVRNPEHSTSDVIAFGTDAKRMLGKTPDRMSVLRPLRKGVIADFDSAAIMMKSFFKRVKSIFAWLQPSLIISLPCVVTKIEREAVREVGYSLGAKKVQLIEEPMAAAVGAEIPVFEPGGNMVVDIGGGTTEIAIISCGGIIYANAVRIGGNDMDESIINYIHNKYHMLIGEQTAEKIKIAYGGAKVRDTESPERRFEVRGRDLISGLPKIIIINTSDLANAVENTVKEVIEAVKTGFFHATPEIASDLYERGIILAGGGALLGNFAKRIQMEIGIPVFLADQPLLTIAQGGFKSLEHEDLLERIAI